MISAMLTLILAIAEKYRPFTTAKPITPKAIRAGITFVNTYRLISPSALFGGMKDSGYGKEAGIESIKDYTRVKTTWYYTSDEPTLDPFSMR